MKKIEATFIVNGTTFDTYIDAHALLVEVLRDELGYGFKGVHESCGAGDCGACTVIVDGVPILSCLTLAVSVRGKQITTIEGLAEGTELHPIQEAFVSHGAIQCGYCTPGMILSAKGLLDQHPEATVSEVKKALAGNLCRCTGYKKIIEAVMSVSKGGN